jgi:hypothetical protein
MVLTRQGTSTAMEGEQNSDPEVQRSSDEVQDEWRMRLEERLNQLTQLVERVVEVQVQGTAPLPPGREAPLVQPTAAGVQPVEERGEPARTPDGRFTRRPGKEVVQESTNSPVANSGDVMMHGGMIPLKIDARVDLQVYDGAIDGEKIDSWIDHDYNDCTSISTITTTHGDWQSLG